MATLDPSTHHTEVAVITRNPRANNYLEAAVGYRRGFKTDCSALFVRNKRSGR